MSRYLSLVIIFITFSFLFFSSPKIQNSLALAQSCTEPTPGPGYECLPRDTFGWGCLVDSQCASYGDQTYPYCMFKYGGSGMCPSDRAGKGLCCKAVAPTPTNTPTPTPIPCHYNDPGSDGWPEQCIDQTGTYTDNCTSNNRNIYSCNGADLCEISSISCNPNACSVLSSGQPVCLAPTATPTPTPGPCQVTTNPTSPINLAVGQAGGITASVTLGLGSATITQMRFGAYDTAIATVNPTSDSTSIYSTTVTGVAEGSTAVWGTADLSDGRTCETTGTTDTDIKVLAPTPTSPPPTPTPTSPPGLYRVNGVIFRDFNGNGTWQLASEPVYKNGVWVSVTDITKSFTNSAQSDSFGFYDSGPIFSDGDSMSTTISGANIPAGCTVTSPNPNSFSITGADHEVDFGLSCPVTIQGHYVDQNGNRIAFNGSTPNKTVTISGGSLSSPVTASNNVSGDPTFWKSNSIFATDTNFTVTTSDLTGYAISYSYSGKNISPPTAPYSSGSSLPVSLFDGGNWADIYFKYTPAGTPTPTPPGAPTATPTPIGGGPTPTPTINPSTNYICYRTNYSDSSCTTFSSATNYGCNTSNSSFLPQVGICQASGIDSYKITSCEVCTPTPTPIPGIYSISGNVYVDSNTSTASTTTGSPYIGPLTAHLKGTWGIGNGISRNQDILFGAYMFNALPSGQYNVTIFPQDYTGNPDLSSPPAGYKMIFTDTAGLTGATWDGTNWTITDGSGGSAGLPYCIWAKSIPPGGWNKHPDASCPSGSITSLHFRIAPLPPPIWFQSTGSDMRWDNPAFSNLIPSEKFASLAGTGGMPGIIFTGAFSPNFGAGKASSTEWQVGSPYPDVFTTTHSLIPSSYRFLSETIQTSGVTPTIITSVNSSLAPGIYKVDENLTIGSPVTFGPGNFVILVGGNLNVNAKITVPVGSTVIFSAKENITVGASVTSTEGLYSADGSFTVNSGSNCPGTPDNALDVAGSVIANAGRSGGTFKNNRTLCAGNTSNPSVTFVERPDFILNFPSSTRQTTKVWQEIAP